MTESIHQQKHVFIDSLNVSLKQWQFLVTWQPVNTLKTGFINRLRKQTQAVDLEIACLLFNKKALLIDEVWFKNMRDQSESVCHRGDDLGKKRHTKNQDNLAQESIDIYLKQIPANVHYIAFVLSSYHGQVLYKNQSAQCSITDDEGEPILQLPLSKLEKNCQAIWLATLNRVNDKWQLITNYHSLSDYRLQNFRQEIKHEMDKYIPLKTLLA